MFIHAKEQVAFSIEETEDYCMVGSVEKNCRLKIYNFELKEGTNYFNLPLQQKGKIELSNVLQILEADEEKIDKLVNISLVCESEIKMALFFYYAKE